MQKTIKRILITGGSGFIGKNLIDHIAKGYELVCIIKNRSYKRKDIKIIYCDVTDDDCVRQAMSNVNAVVHIAAILDPFNKNILKVNVDSTRLLVDIAKTANVKRFIFISTENVLYNFDDAYTITKRTAEKIVKTFKNYLILRPTLVYGRYDKRYVKKIVDIAKKYRIVPVPGEGKTLLQPVYVEDVIKCIENGLRYNVKGEYIVAGPSKITYDDFVGMILETLNIKKRIVHIPLSLFKLFDCLNRKVLKTQIMPIQVKSLETDKVYDIKKTIRALRYKPTSFKAGIKKTIKFLNLL